VLPEGNPYFYTTINLIICKRDLPSFTDVLKQYLAIYGARPGIQRDLQFAYVVYPESYRHALGLHMTDRFRRYYAGHRAGPAARGHDRYYGHYVGFAGWHSAGSGYLQRHCQGLHGCPCDDHKWGFSRGRLDKYFCEASLLGPEKMEDCRCRSVKTFVRHPVYPGYYFPITIQRTSNNPKLVENPGYH